MDEEPAQWNNRSVALIKAGDYRSAFDLLRCSLQHVVTDLGSNNANENPDSLQSFSSLHCNNFRDAKHVENNQCHLHSSNFSAFVRQYCADFSKEYFTRAKHLSLASQITDESNLHRHNAPNNHAFVHTEAFTIVPTSADGSSYFSPNRLVNKTIVAAIIIFNLALVHHLKGLEENNKLSGREKLEKARIFYLRSCTMLSDAGVGISVTLRRDRSRFVSFLSSSGNTVVDILCMALLNNLAQISHDFASYDQSRLYLTHLTHFASTVTPSNYNYDPLIANTLDKYKQNFMLNVIILQYAPRTAPAA